MNRFKPFFLFAFLIITSLAQYAVARANDPHPQVTIIMPEKPSVRIIYGADKIEAALKEIGYTVRQVRKDDVHNVTGSIIIGTINDRLYKVASALFKLNSKPEKKEGFTIHSSGQKNIVIGGFDPSGTLYGCMELADQIHAKRVLPKNISITDAPEMVLRGACVGIQKPTLLPGRGVYEYPYTPELFPWFYDKALWIRYLDSLAENRMNSLYLWNGHPFASLVKLKD